jgi:hypothetical protein
MRKRVGYFDGTDSDLLTALICAGVDTIPIANGLDNHGQHARLINDDNRYDLLLTPLYKIYAPEDHDADTVTYQDLFRICHTYTIPLLIAVPTKLRPNAEELLGDIPPVVRLVDPSNLFAVAAEILGKDVSAPAGAPGKETGWARLKSKWAQ